MAEIAEENASSESPQAPAFQRCDKCGKEFKLAFHWKKHLASPPAYCIAEQARRARKEPAANVGVAISEGALCASLASLRQSHFLPDHIPKSVRRLVSSAFCDVLKEVSETNSVAAWRRLLLFSYRTLGQPRTEPEERTLSLPQVIRNNLQAGAQNFSGSLPSSSNVQRKKPKDSQIVKQVARKIQDGDLTGAVRTLVAAETILPSTPETLDLLQSKHPKG